MLVLDDGDTAHHRERLEDPFGYLGYHVPQRPVDGPLVGDLRPPLFAHPDDEHLREPALDGAVEVGVRLDAVYRNDRVGTDRVRVTEDGNVAVGRPSDLDDLHARPDLAADGRFGDSELVEHLQLSVGRRAAVAPHRGEHERVVSGVGERVHDAGDDLGEVRDATATDAESDLATVVDLVEG